MRILDLFCGAGGAAMGLHQAFPEALIIGVDIVPQKNYPFVFVLADAMTYPLGGFDLIWASPPCQHYTAGRHFFRRKGNNPYPDLIEGIRNVLEATNCPWVIENVPGAPLINPLILCGSHFDLKSSDGFHLRRHRLFEASQAIAIPKVCRHAKPVIGVYGDHPRDRSRQVQAPTKDRPHNRPHNRPLEAAAEAMGIDWMEWRELTQAIPPPYSRYIGEQFKLTKGI